MDQTLRRKLALDTYHTLIAQLNDRGVLIDTLSSDQLDKMDMDDLDAVNKRYQGLLRNPIPRG